VTSALSVRLAGEEDAYALWIWANDPETRAASFCRARIPWAEHRSWLSQTLVNPGRVTLIAVLGPDQPVGSIRFDSDDGWTTARLSYVIAPEARGKGLSGLLVLAGTEWVVARQPDVRVWARVLDSNQRSLRVFRRLGWTEDHDGEGGARFWRPTRDR
jgi:UDP-2,4-diacetamido-2,4,6-trideoxy-beta-L-altropyranose hydrolase